MEWVWVFHGENAHFSSAVFSEKHLADAWVRKASVSGVLTKMPVDMGVYDWVVENGYFTPRNPSQKSPDFVQKFSSAYLEHVHYQNGIPQNE